MEMLAEVASLLFPGKRVVALKKIRAQRWIALEESQLTLQMVARRVEGAGDFLQAEVRIYEVSEPAEVSPSPGALRAEGMVLFGDSYPEPPRAGEFSLRAERPSKWLPEQLYTDYMFHGPSLRGVVSIERFGEDGTEATLATLPFERLFRSPAAQGFLTDPALLDAAGQLVGYWITEHQERGFHVFPFGVEALYLYGENRPAGELLKCRARIALRGEWQTVSDLELVGADGRLLAKLEGWEDRRFDVPKPFYHFRSSPRDRFLSTPLSIDVEGLPLSETYSCCLLNTLSTEFLEGFGKIWQHVLAQLVLSRREREGWRDLKGPEARRSQWLLGRVVAKDAARRLLSNLHGTDLCPADIEIIRDEHGRPLVGGAWRNEPRGVPLISLAHTENAAVALACDAGACEGVGIDLERLRPLNEDFKSAAFTDAERSLVHAQEESFDEDECFLRLWCAKEAIAKAFGRGLLGGGRGVVALGLDARTGVVEVALASEMALRFPPSRGASWRVRTAREGDLIIAIAFIKGTVDEGAEDERA
jgi:phosphopantetheinyl transferase